MLSKSKLKYIQSLGQKKFRDKENVFVAEGPRIIEEWIQSIPHQIMEIYAVSDWLSENESSLKNILHYEVSETELKKISQLTTPQKVLALVKKFSYQTPLPAEKKITLALDTVQDPGNLGTIIRIADWFGVHQVVCSQDTADVYNPKTIQASMGSLSRVPVIYTELSEWIARQPAKIFSATLNGENLFQFKKISEGIVIIGNEARGVREELLQLSHHHITIPRKGKAESLNAAVATGIILSHFV
ncbi:MAG: RNA methyltransferase [Chitinophagaceae bacterium]|nr:RNA methyltransferase [Chitinophagaceae bacterium]